MDILHVASEFAPYAKVGGLADVVSALTKHLRLLGHKVTVALPRYRAFSESGPAALARRLTPLAFVVDGKTWEAHIYDGKTTSGVELLLIDLPGFHDRSGIYGEQGETYPDNSARFALFCHAVLALIEQRAQTQHPFSVVHVHDWQTALIPFLLRRQAASRPATVLSLHNLAHQGVTPREQQAALGLTDDDFSLEGVEFFGHINLLKAGIIAADALTTVSETYARDMLTPEHGARLDGVLQARENDLTGIVNGVDGSVWNPATDGAIAARYDVEDIANKTRCKGALLAELRLDLSVERPLFSFVGRLVQQKGADLILAALPKLLASDLTLVITGEGDDTLMKKIEAACSKHSKHVAFISASDERMVHRIYAGSDFLLVPSRFEPCGLVQLYAQRYGTLPVAHATGGLTDTIVDCDVSLETGTGFLFETPTAASLVGAVQRARAAFQQPGWSALIRRVMRLDRGWERPARRYEQIYRKLCSPT